MERRQKWAGGAQRKVFLVNGVGSKANKSEGKRCGNWAREAQKI